MAFPLKTSFPSLSLDCAVKVGRVILEHVECLVEVNKGSLMATISTLSNLTRHSVQLYVPSDFCHCVSQGAAYSPFCTFCLSAEFEFLNVSSLM